jgi:hypothetical protein
MQQAIRQGAGISEKLIKQENIAAFKTVEKEFRVIEDDAKIAVVDPALTERLRNFEDVSWCEIQSSSVRVREKILVKFAKESSRYPGVWLWGAEYSPFIGYMEAVLKLEKFSEDSFAIV